VYPGFWSCPIVGKNHPVHPETCCALVGASPELYEVRETSALDGATIQATFDDLQINLPPSIAVPNETWSTLAGKNLLQVPELLMQPRLMSLQVPD
jgi:hypothetical protein